MTRPCRYDSAGIFLSVFSAPPCQHIPIAATSSLNLLRHLFAPPFISSRLHTACHALKRRCTAQILNHDKELSLYARDIHVRYSHSELSNK